MNSQQEITWESYYSTIGLREFASNVEVEEVLREYESRLRSDRYDDGQSDSMFRRVFSVLREPQNKQWYDLLLEARIRSTGFLPPIASPVERDAIRAFANSLGIELVAESERVLRLHPPSDRTTVSNPEISDKQFPVLLGSLELVVHAFFCSAHEPHDLYQPQISLRWQGVQSIPLRSNRVKVIARPADKVVLFGTDPNPSIARSHAGYVNRSQRIFSPLEHAARTIFSGGREEVAQRLGVRARPRTIRKAIQDYFGQLANAICLCEPEISRASVHAKCKSFAKKLFPER